MGELPRLRVLMYLNDQFEVLGAMDELASLPEEELQAKEEADVATYTADELDDVNEDFGLKLRDTLATAYSYLHTLRDRRLCKVCAIEDCVDTNRESETVACDSA